MKVIHEYTGELISMEDSCLVVTGNNERDQIISGYVRNGETTSTRLIKNNGDTTRIIVYTPLYHKMIFYSNALGCYGICFSKDKYFLNRIKYEHGIGGFPYNFKRHYEAIESFELFNGRQIIDTFENIGKYLNYTFGLEFETKGGYIPEDKCFEAGLIPLRDGSIPGLEYSTTILKGCEGINQLKLALPYLRKYTGYNKSCSLHMHLGGFPLDPKKIWKLYKFIYKFQFLIQPYISEYAFNTKYFKDNEKDYCKKLPLYRSFNQFFKSIAGNDFLGDFFQPHPNDRFHEAKWRIPSRYYLCNFVNLLCYDKNKTVEFRFLHPTFNFNRIVLWMLIFNAILYNAEYMKDVKEFQRIEDLFRIYPRNIQKQLFLGLQDLLDLKRLQIKDGDEIDMDNTHEYQVFSNLNFDI